MKVKSNNNRQERLDLEYLVLKNFITVMKKNGMYPMFRCVVGTNTKNVVSSIYKRMHSFEKFYKNQSKENVFANAGNIETFVKMMKETSHGGVNVEEYRVQAPGKLQQLIANTINMLLHIFVERNVRDIHVLESLGGQIFDMTCREVFGGEFEDMLPQPTPEMEKMRQMHEMMSARGMKPTPEMIDEINRMIAEGRLPQFPDAPAPGQPMVNEEDWDFLDDFLGDDDEEDEEFYDEEDEDFDVGEAGEEINWAAHNDWQ